MNVVDLVLVVAILVFAITGWRRGFLYGLLSLAGFLVGGAVGLWLAPKLVGSWDDGVVKALTALVIVFFLATLGQVLVGMVGRRLHGAVTWKPAVVLNQSAGAVLSVMSLLLVAWFAANMFVHDNRTALARDVRQSQVLAFVDNVVPLNPTVVTGEIQGMFSGTGFPDVFSGNWARTSRESWPTRRRDCQSASGCRCVERNCQSLGKRLQVRREPRR